MEPTSTSDLISTKNELFSPITAEQAKQAADALVAFVNSNNLSINIAGKRYLLVEAWQFIGMQMCLTEIVRTCDQVAPFEESDEIKYKAEVEIINQQGTVMSRGFAWCSNKEQKKKSFDEYAVASMAQTRAIGKAYRNKFAWIVKMAGYEGTPADEINRELMEDSLSKKKQDVLAALNAKDIIAGKDIMAYIEKILGKRTIETIDEADKIISSLKENEL